MFNKNWIFAACITITTTISPYAFGEEVDTYETMISEIEIGHIGIDQALPNRYRIHAWMDSAFRGEAGRSWESNDTAYRSLWVWLKQDAGGYDATIARDSSGVKINNTDIGAGIYYDIGHNTLDGVWWSGAKVVLSTTPDYQGLAGTDNYEAYIVEQSNLSPENLAERFSYYLDPMGEFEVDGKMYKHYTGTLPGANINQILSIRQNRQVGPAGEEELVEDWIPVGVILKNQWVPEEFVDGEYYQLGWMAFVETQDRNHGEFFFSYLGFYEEDPS